MRIAWATPCERTSSIGAFSVEVVRALRARGVAVDVWGTAADDALDFDEAIQWLDPATAGVGGEYDHVVYNLGNNPVYHSGIFDAYRRRPGVVVMHDKAMLEFFMSRAATPRGWDRGRVARFVARLGHYYDGPGLAFSEVLRDPSLRTGAMVEGEHGFPLFEPCLANASGIVTHSRSALLPMADRYGDLVPSACLDLPLIFDARYRDPAALLDRGELDVAPGDLVIVIHGFVTPVKRVHAVVDAIASDPTLATSALLVVAGGAEPGYAEDLARLGSKRGVAERVRITGRVDDLTLYSYIANADICVNLRMPSTEAASASLGEQLHFGRPTIVSDVGSFSELPDGIVAKVDMADEAASLARALRELASDPAERAALGAAGRAYAVERFSAERYADGLLDLLARVEGAAGLLRVVDDRADAIARGQAPTRVREAARLAAAEIAAGGAVAGDDAGTGSR